MFIFLSKCQQIHISFSKISHRLTNLMNNNWLFSRFSARNAYPSKYFFRPQYPFRTFLKPWTSPPPTAANQYHRKYSVIWKTLITIIIIIIRWNSLVYGLKKLRMNNKLVGSWLMISISIEICDSVWTWFLPSISSITQFIYIDFARENIFTAFCFGRERWKSLAKLFSFIPIATKNVRYYLFGKRPILDCIKWCNFDSSWISFVLAAVLNCPMPLNIKCI